MSRLLQALLVLLLVDTDVAERVSEQRRHNPGVPAEYSHIPSQAVLVSEMLVSPCSGYRFPPPRRSPADYCYDHALETIACAVIAAGGVELWVMVMKATPPDPFGSRIYGVSENTTQDAFLEYFDTRYPTHCLSALNSTDRLVFIQNNFGASQVWVRDYAPALSIDKRGKPDKLLRLPYKKVSTRGLLYDQFNDISLVQALSIDIADQIGYMVNDGVSGPPTIYEHRSGINLTTSFDWCNLDWGNFEADGQGMCLSTNWKRTFNLCPNLKQFLTENAGCKHFPGDLVPFPESTTHPRLAVDIFARFYGPRQLLMAKYEKAEPVKTLDGGSATMVHEAEEIANGHRNDWVKNLEKSEKLEIADLPTPKGVYKSSLGNDVLVGYANVVLIQGTQRVLLFPTFGNRLESLVQHKRKNKEEAAKKEWMTKLDIQEQHVFDIVVDGMMEFGGGPHCITKQYQFEGGGGR
jgi:hypothetical protein